MSDFNTCTFTGNLTADPLVRGEGGNVVELTIAVNRQWQKDGEWINAEPTFITISCFGHIAQKAKTRFSKGNAVFVSGRMEQHNWTADSGEKRSKLRLVANSLMAGAPNKSNSLAEATHNAAVDAAASESRELAPVGGDDDIPF